MLQAQNLIKRIESIGGNITITLKNTKNLIKRIESLVRGTLRDLGYSMNLIKRIESRLVKNPGFTP